MPTQAENAAFINKRVAEGTATPEMQAWYDRQQQAPVQAPIQAPIQAPVQAPQEEDLRGMLGLGIRAPITPERSAAYQEALAAIAPTKMNYTTSNGIRVGVQDESDRLRREREKRALRHEYWGSDTSQATWQPPAEQPAAPTGMMQPSTAAAGDAPMQIEGRDAKWEANKNHILMKAQAGTASPQELEWLNRFEAAGGQPLAPEQVDPFADNYAYKKANEATAGLVKGESSMEDINAWYNDVHRLYRNNPEAFNQWAKQNPEMAVRFGARSANKNVGIDWNRDGVVDKEDNKLAQRFADQTAFGMGMEAGYGKDGVKDGRMFASDYKTFDDITNEWGAGDFWKIGTESTLPGGISGMYEQIKSDPVGTLGPIVAAVAISYLAGPLALQLGISEAAAGAILQGTASFAQGGSVNDVLKEVALGYGLDVGLEKLAPYMKDFDYIKGGDAGFGLGTISADEQLGFIRKVAKSGGDVQGALINTFAGEIGQGIFGNDEIYNTLSDRGWTPEAMAKSTQQMIQDGLSGEEIKDILINGVQEYRGADGKLGTVPLPDFDIGDIPGSEVLGDLAKKGEQALDEVYEFVRDDLPDIQPEWLKGDWDLASGGLSESAPRWLRDLIDEAGQYGDEVYEFIRDDLPDIQPDLPDIDLPDIDLPQVALPGLPDMPEMPGLPDMPALPGLPDLPGMPDMPNVNLPSINIPGLDIPDLSFGTGMMGPAESELAKLFSMPKIKDPIKMGPFIYQPGMFG